MMGQPIVPGDLGTPAKLQLTSDDGFAFLNLLPQDIQPSIVGDYDFIAANSSEQLSDPIAMQENFFTAMDRTTNPTWVQGLASQGKMPNFAALTEKVYDKLQMGLESKDVITDMPAPQAPVAPQQAMSQPQAALPPELANGLPTI